MIIQLRGVTEEFAEKLKALTQETTASKAFLHAASSYADLVFYSDRLGELLDERDQEIQRLIGIIDGARTAAALLLDRTGQIDLDLPEGH